MPASTSTDLDPRIARSRAAVLDATVGLLAERGVAATTLEAIAERSGVAKTTIYRHWASKPEVVLDAIGTLVEPPADPDTGSVREDLYQLVEGLRRGLSHSPLAALLPSLIDAAERDPEFAALHRTMVAAQHAVVHNVLMRGVRRGELPRDLDPDELVSLLAGPVFYRRLVTHGAVEAAFGRRVVDVLLAATAAHPDPKTS